MGREIDLELRFSAEEQYITGQVTLEQLATATGISVSTLSQWAADEKWVERRREYRQAFSDIKRNTVELRRAFVKKALTSLNPMDAFAISALEKLAMAAEKSSAPGAPAPVLALPAGEPVFNTPAEAVAVLKGIIEQKLARMLITPDSVNLAAVKEVKQALDLVGRMQAEVAPEVGAAPNILSDDRIKEIREQLKL